MNDIPAHALILGGTKGLGLALAEGAAARGIAPIVVGRTAHDLRPRGWTTLEADLSKAGALEWIPAPAFASVRHVIVSVGMFLKKPLTDCTDAELAAICGTNLFGVIANVRGVHKMLRTSRPRASSPGQPYHFTMISSTSAWKSRENESTYGALCAARSQFARNFARELVRDLPGSKATLVQPGGMNTPNFWSGVDQDLTNFMKPEAVAEIVWSRVTAQSSAFDEFSIIRQQDGSPRVEDGPRAPDAPL